MKDLKNTLTTVFGLLIAICTALLGITGQVMLPKWLNVVCIVVIAVGTAFIGWATGRNADLTKKSSKQIDRQIDQK